MDESTVMANRLAHLDKQIAALQERNRLLQAEAEIRQNKNTYLALPGLLTAAFVLAVLGLAWWLRRRMLSRPVRPEPRLVCPAGCHRADSRHRRQSNGIGFQSCY